MKLIPGFRIRLYFQRNSTVFTVFGHTILIESAMRTTSKTIAGISPANHPINIQSTGKSKSRAGTTKASMVYKLKS